MISPKQRPLPDNRQHSQQTNIHAPVGFEPTVSAGERPQTYALDRAATGTYSSNSSSSSSNSSSSSSSSLLFLSHKPSVGHALLIHEVSSSPTTIYHSRYVSSGRVISPPQRPLPDNTQHSQQTSMPPVRFEPTISAGERPQTYALDRAATGTSSSSSSKPLEPGRHWTETVRTVRSVPADARVSTARSIWMKRVGAVKMSRYWGLG